MIIMAIDPGLKGGIAVTTDWHDFKAWPMPVRRFGYGTDRRGRGKVINHVDVVTLHWLATMTQAEEVVVEQQTNMPGQGAPSGATTFANYGLILSLRLLLPVHVVHPATWKAKLSVPADKEEATQRCRELMGPQSPDCDGPAEALMLAHYWRLVRLDDTGTDQAELRRARAVGKAKAVRRSLWAGTAGPAGAPGAVAEPRADRLDPARGGG